MSLKPLQPYPGTVPSDVDGIQTVVQKITQIRQNDQTLWNSLPSQLIAGRRVTKVPASSTDITDSAVGDLNITATYGYACINNAGTVEWVRWSVGSF